MSPWIENEPLGLFSPSAEVSWPRQVPKSLTRFGCTILNEEAVTYVQFA